jgi:hypothetical protein
MASNLKDNLGNHLRDPDGNIRLSSGTAVPTDATQGYAIGAIHQKDGGTLGSSLYVNNGTTSSCGFVPLIGGGSTNEGLTVVNTAKAIYDPSGTTSLKATGTYSLAATVPNGALIVGGFARVNTAFASSGSTSSVAVFVQGANDIIAAATVGGAPWSTTGTKAVVPNGTTAGGGIATTAAAAIKVIVANEALTAGKATFYVNYIV